MARTRARVDRQRRQTAAHEAAHAAVAWLIGHPVRVELSAPDAGATATLDRTPPANALLIALAGILADPTAPPGLLCDRHVGDLVNVVRCAEHVNPADPEEAIRAGGLIVSRMLTWPRTRQIMRVLTDALAARGALSAEEVDAVIVQGLGAILASDAAKDSERS